MDAASLQEISSTLKKITLVIDDSLDAPRSERPSETPNKTPKVPSTNALPSKFLNILSIQK